MTYVHGNSAVRLNILYAKAKKERCRERERKKEREILIFRGYPKSSQDSL